ncbi:MAG: hypothetical protein FWG82_00885 [Oscillospiraceae bacterium]|nr:hypothetical protein [Oscillospiraceae bacterium]
MKKTMNVLLSCDNRIAKYVPTLQVSLYENHPDIDVHIYFMYARVDENTVTVIEDFAGQHGMSFTKIKVDNRDFEFFGKADPKRLHMFPYEAYYHMLAHEYLPEDLDRIVYLDVDTLCVGDLFEWYSNDFQDHFYIAANRYGRHDFRAFNAGCFLINLNKMCAENIDLDFYAKKVEQIVSLKLNITGDQETVGFSFRQYNNNGFLVLPKEEKQPTGGINFMPRRNRNCLFGERQFPDLRIIHYTYHKPWKYVLENSQKDNLLPLCIRDGVPATVDFDYSVATDSFLKLFNMYWDYASKAPFYDENYKEAQVRTQELTRLIPETIRSKKMELMQKAKEALNKSNLLCLDATYNDCNFVVEKTDDYMEFRCKYYIKEQWIVFPLTKNLSSGDNVSVNFKCAYKTDAKICLFLVDSDLKTQHFPVINESNYQASITIDNKSQLGYSYLCLSSNSFPKKGDYIRIYDGELKINSKK